MQDQQIESEIHELAESFRSKNGEYVTAAACLLYLTKNGLTNRARINKTDVQPLIELQREWMHLWLVGQSIPISSVNAAIQDLRRAGATAHYIALIPT